MEKLVLIDGNSLFNRAFYATPSSFSTKEGVPTNAVYGFTTMLFKAITDLKPTHLAVAFDFHAPTFRHKMYDKYKGTRKPMPEDLRVQVPLIKNMIKAMNITIYELEGYEADDILGTIAKKIGVETLILTGDNDYLQLIDDSTTVYLTKKGLSELAKMDKTALFDERGLTPKQIIDLKSLMGDSSDNIPGVPGVGEKTATTLIQKYSTLDGVYQNIEEIKGALYKKLSENRDGAYLSKTLATIDVNVPIKVDLDDMQLKLPFPEKVKAVFNEYEFKSLLKRTEFFGDASQNEIANKDDFKSVVLSDISDLKKVLSENASAQIFAFDLSDSPTFSFGNSIAYKVEIAKDLFGGISFEEFIQALKPILSGDVPKIVYDNKALKHSLKNYNAVINNAKYDISLMQYLVNFEPSANSLSALIKFYDLNYDNNAAALMVLKNELITAFDDTELNNLYFNVELPLSDVLYEMEITGFKVDEAVVAELREQFTKEIQELTEKIYQLAGEKFNINSPKQLGEILYVKLNLAKGKKTKTGLSTSAEELERLYDEHEIIPYLLRYRKINKLLTAYVEGMGAEIESDGKIHTVFNQALTVTGRLSSKEPNLQTIPIRSDEGRILRKLFVPEKPDNLLVSADYSQIELRLLAHFANDPVLIDAYKNGKDIHATTAASVFNVSLNDVTKDMRRAAKAVNFGIIYGISDFGLAKQIGVSTKVAKEYIKRYFEKYPKVHNYMNKNVEFCREHGYVSTITGRKRKIREINSSNFVQRSFGERAAMNMPLQGSAADIIKIAMNRVFKRLKDEELKSKLVLQVHDELIIDAEKTELDEIIKILKDEMENAVSLNVPLPVNVSFGENLYEAK